MIMGRVLFQNLGQGPCGRLTRILGLIEIDRRAVVEHQVDPGRFGLGPTPEIGPEGPFCARIVLGVIS